MLTSELLVRSFYVVLKITVIQAKTHTYWPSLEENMKQYGLITVTILHEEHNLECRVTHRRFQLVHSLVCLFLSQISSHLWCKLQEAPKIVEHYQYNEWPAHGIPGSTEHIRKMLRRIGQTFPLSSLPLPLPPPIINVKTSLPCPTIVHCR